MIAPHFSKLRLSTSTPHKWTLDSDFTFYCQWNPAQGVLQSWTALGLDVSKGGNTTVIRVPRGLTTDLGSSPRAMWWFCSPVDIAMAAVIHDNMYGLISDARRAGKLGILSGARRRREADDVFLMALNAQPSMWWVRAWASWAAVRVFGWFFAYA